MASGTWTSAQAGRSGTEKGYWKGEDNQSENTLGYFDQERSDTTNLHKNEEGIKKFCLV